jgi:hypothetical protein
MAALRDGLRDQDVGTRMIGIPRGLTISSGYALAIQER